MTTMSAGKPPRAQGPAVILNHRSGLARATRIKEIFEAHNWPTLVVDEPERAAWVVGVRRPMVDVITALASDFRRFAPELVASPQKSMYRIYRDTRFSENKTPLKTHVAAHFPRRS